MSGRRTRGSFLQPRPRVKNGDSKSVAFKNDNDDDDTTANMSINTLRANIFVPPQLQKGLIGRDGTDQYNPYSPNPTVASSVSYWPQQQLNHRPIASNYENNNNMDATFRTSNAVAAKQKKIKQQLEEINERTKARVVRRPRGNGVIYLDASVDERQPQDYREMDDDDEHNASASYLQSPSTIGSYSNDDGGGTFSMVGSIDTNIKPNDKSENDRLGFITKSISESGTFETITPTDLKGTNSDGGDSFFKTNQPPAFCTIAITSIQLLILMLQLAMCGVATLEVNPTIGPFPDAFSQWGGKNPYLTLHNNQWWRLITPAFLHVGVAHLAVNIYCQATAATMFERDWGWSKWLFVYITSEIGCSTFSNLFDPDSIAVGSTGALMGLFAAKLSQVVIFSLHEIKNEYDDAIRLDQLSNILCGLTLASLLGALTYIDFSGNLGGLVSGFLLAYTSLVLVLRDAVGDFGGC